MSETLIPLCKCTRGRREGGRERGWGGGGWRSETAVHVKHICYIYIILLCCQDYTIKYGVFLSYAAVLHNIMCSMVV